MPTWPGQQCLQVWRKVDRLTLRFRAIQRHLDCRRACMAYLCDYLRLLGLQVQFHDSDLHLHSEFIAPGTVVCDSTSGSVSGSDCIDLFNAVEASICWQVADPKVCTANKAVSGTLSAYVSLLQSCYAFNPNSQNQSASSQHTLQQYSLEQLAVCCCIVVSRNSIRTSLNQALGKDG